MRKALATLWLLVMLAGCASTAQRDFTPMAARLFLETSGGVAVTLPQSGVTIPVGAQPVVTEFDLSGVEIARVELGDCLLLRLSASAARDLYRMTAANQGRRLVLTVNGEALGARRIDGPMSEGLVLVFVEIPDAKLPELVKNLRATAAEAQRKAEKS